MRAICIYVGYTKATTNNQDIRSSVTVKSLFANITWIAKYQSYEPWTLVFYLIFLFYFSFDLFSYFLNLGLGLGLVVISQSYCHTSVT